MMSIISPRVYFFVVLLTTGGMNVKEPVGLDGAINGNPVSVLSHSRTSGQRLSRWSNMIFLSGALAGSDLVAGAGVEEDGGVGGCVFGSSTASATAVVAERTANAPSHRPSRGFAFSM